MASYAASNTCVEAGALACWLEWEERCALARCEAETQYVLTEFAGHQFTRYLQRYAHQTNLPERATGPSGRDAWHLLESRMTVHGTREGKCYKKWLFARGCGNKQERLKVVQGGAAVLMRDVVRDHLRHECSPSSVVPLESPISAYAEGLTVADLIPGRADPRNEVAQRELAELGRGHAEEFLAALTSRERIALLAKHLGLSLAHPAIVTAAGCGKSMLNETYRATFGKLAETLRDLYAGEDAESLRLLVVLTYQCLNDLVTRWVATEAHYPQLLPLLEMS